MPETTATLREKITELQMMQMDHERSIDNLSEQLHLQQSRIERMQQQLESLIEHIKSIKESLSSIEGDDMAPPPHY